MNKNIIANIVIGIVLGAVFLFGIYTVYEDHQTIKQLVSFANQVISASQKSATPTTGK